MSMFPRLARSLRPRLARPLALAALALPLVLAGACTESLSLPDPDPVEPKVRPAVPSDYRTAGLAAAGYTHVHLFDWRWGDIANECETVLGPAGVYAAQVSPPTRRHESRG